MKKILLFSVILTFPMILWAQDPQTEPVNPKQDPPQQNDSETKSEKKDKDSIPKSAQSEIKAVVEEPDTLKKKTTEPEVKYYQSFSNKNRRPKRSKRNRDDIRTLTGGMNHSGGFGALTFKSSDFRGETMILAGIRGGWIINRTLGIGIEGHGIIPTTKYDDLNPTDGEETRVLGGYGGMFLEPIFFSNEVVHITFPISAGAGWLGYEEVSSRGPKDITSEDVFWYAEPGVALEINIARHFRLNFGVSKRFTQDLDMYNTNQDDFNTTNYFLGLKIGGF